MLDILYVAGTAGFFLLCGLAVRACARFQASR